MNILKRGILKSYILFLVNKVPGANWNGLTFIGTSFVGLGLPLLIITSLLTPIAERAYKEVEPLVSEYPPIAIGVSLSLIATPLATPPSIEYEDKKGEHLK